MFWIKPTDTFENYLIVPGGKPEGVRTVEITSVIIFQIGGDGDFVFGISLKK